MKSIFLKNFIIYSLVVMLSFTALGGAFVYQINQFAADEKETQLNTTAQYAVQSTEKYLKTSVGALDFSRRMEAAEQYRINIMQLAGNLNGRIFICDAEGNLQFYGTADGCYAQENGVVSQEAITAITKNGSYNETGTFAGLLNSPHFTKGLPVKINGTLVATVFTSMPADASLKLFINISSTFIFMIFSVFLVVLIVTYVMVDSTLRPLKNITAASRNFARGDFSSRVPLPKRRDELYSMTLSFNRMADAIENMENQRRDLVANVSHDLRTPMTTIGGFIDGILDGTIKPDRQEYYLNIVSEEIKRLSRLANSMLEVSRLDSGEKALNKTSFDLSEMIRRIVIGFEKKLEEKKLDLTLDIPEQGMVTADHDAIFQVVYNLIDNAVKFTNDNGSIIICLTMKKGKVQFNIVNTGAGIAPDDLKHIFDRFYKGDRSRNSGVKSSGLGLYIVKTLVNRHGGDISAKSDEEHTEFCFTIPANE
ncbi:sensor histidine kinase [Acidaminobacterium chupaoyuni]